MLDLSPPDFFGDILVHDCNNWKPRYQKIGNSSLIQRFLGKSQESLVQTRSGPTSATMRAALGCARTNPCWALGPSRTSSVARIFAQAPARSTQIDWGVTMSSPVEMKSSWLDATVSRCYSTPMVPKISQTNTWCALRSANSSLQLSDVLGGYGRMSYLQGRRPGQSWTGILNNLISCILLKTTSW
jgi:hypothetical protein